MTNGTLAAVLPAATLLIAATIPNLSRPGFSPDEEITAVTLRGLSETGLPMLPSGALYLRGLAYSYAAWLGGSVLGQGLEAYRTVSLVFAVVALVLMVRVARQVAAPWAAACAALLLCTFPPFLAAASFARFYAPFMMTALLVLWAFLRPHEGSREWVFLCALALCRLTHEFAVVLTLLPFSEALCDATERRRSTALFLKSLALLVVMQAGLTLAEGLSVASQVGASVPRIGVFGAAALAAPPWHIQRSAGASGASLIVLESLLFMMLSRRLTRTPWLLLVAFAIAGATFELGVLLLLTVVGMVIAPSRAVRVLAAGAIATAASVAGWLLVTALRTDLALSARIPVQLAASTLWYPWEGFIRFARMSPLLTLLASGAAVMALRQAVPGSSRLRVLTLFALGLFTALGAAGVDLHWRYMLLASPIPVLLAAHAIDATGRSIAGSIAPRAPRPAIASAIGLALVALVAVDHYRTEARAGGPPVGDPALLAAPTDALWQADVLRAVVQPTDVVVSNDELAADFLVGRVDYWLLTSPRTLERYTAVRNGERRGFYAGATILADEAAVDRLVRCSGQAVAIVVLDSGKFDFDESRAVAERIAATFNGTVRSAGGAHLIARIPPVPATSGCQGGPL
jgi:hypothetical protein